MEEINLKEFKHTLPVQLRFNDIDILGHLNNIVYFSLYDLAKAKFMQELYEGKMDWNHVESVIANVNCTYIKQIKFGEEIEVKSKVERVGNRSFTIKQCLVETPTQEVRSVCETVMVCFDPSTGHSAPMRPEFRAALENYNTKDKY